MMISGKERRILAEIEQHLRREDPGLARRFEAATAARSGWHEWMSWAMSVEGIIVWLVLLIASLLLGLTVAALVFFVLMVCGGFAQAGRSQ
jgi:Flp pilus assembly protein TadB